MTDRETSQSNAKGSVLTQAALGKCPNCGEGKLFSGVLNVADQCDQCDLSFEFQDAGDGPTVFVIMIMGAVMAGLMLYAEFVWGFTWWMHLIVWPIFLLLVGTWMIRFSKALLINLQFKNDAGQGVLDKHSEDS